MTLKSMLIAAASALAITYPARAGEELKMGPIPDWVERHAIELPDGDPTSQAVRILLVDNQVKLEDGKRTTYSSFGHCQSKCTGW